jgi:hypothetical protein
MNDTPKMSMSPESHALHNELEALCDKILEGCIAASIPEQEKLTIVLMTMGRVIADVCISLGVAREHYLHILGLIYDRLQRTRQPEDT